MVAYSGNIISASSPTPTGPLATGTASGVWTLAEQAYWTQRGLWPTAGNLPPRGLWGGGGNPAASFNGSSVISYITITTLGNAAAFGNLAGTQTNLYLLSACASSTRAIFAGGINTFTTQYVTIATLGNTTSFGTTTLQYYSTGSNSSTRGVFAGGYDVSNVSSAIVYVTIATTGNTQSFGFLTTTMGSLGSCASPTRIVFAGGFSAAGTVLSTISYITTSTLGNALSFGNLTTATAGISGCSSSTRGLFAGGALNSGLTTRISAIVFVTIASLGNSSAFGNLAIDAVFAAGVSGSGRAVFNTGRNATNSNLMGFVTIETTGNTTNFGTNAVNGGYDGAPGCSSANGGL